MSHTTNVAMTALTQLRCIALLFPSILLAVHNYTMRQLPSRYSLLMVVYGDK